MADRKERAVLVVEDEPLLRMFASDVLPENGFRVYEAANADEAVQILETERHIGAVVTDIEMPGTMNGLVLADLILKRWPDVTVLICSGKIAAASELPDGACFISKPYNPDNLLQLLHEQSERKARPGK
jgi:DNA-binding NtrC family response regulator